MITDFIIEKSGLKTYQEGNYKAFNSGGVECETGEFLYGFVRITKPKRILETGTHKGISSTYMALALKDNGSGIITTIEFDPQFYQEAKTLWTALEIRSYIDLQEMRVEDVKIESEYDILFLDSEPEYRWGELERFYPNLKAGGYAFIHDLHRSYCFGNFNPDHPDYENWPFGKIPNKINEYFKDKELVPFHFGTDRGLAGFYKPRSDDYTWTK